MAVRTGMDIKPRSNPDRLPLDLDGDHCIERRAPLFDFPPVRVLYLLSVRIEFLAEVADATEQAYEHAEKVKIRAGSRGIAPKNPQPTGIGVHFRSNRNFH